AEAVVTDQAITGTLTEVDPQTKQPRVFSTVPLWNYDLATRLEQHGVKYAKAATGWPGSW
ncbi:MAG TPA: hypothetical protein VIC71_12430, partial [Gammaproteobacteria bacterium]